MVNTVVCSCGVCVCVFIWALLGDYCVQTDSKLGQNLASAILIMTPEQTRKRAENTLPVKFYLRVTHRVKTTQPLKEDNSQRQKQADR